MPSKQVVDKQKSAELVVAATETHAQTIEQALQALLQPHLKAKEAAPPVAPLVGLLGRMLSARTQAMVQADEAHERELADDQKPRDERDEAAVELNAYLVELREIATGLFTAKMLPGLGMSGPTPRDPVALSRFASQVAAHLRKARMPKPRIKGAQWDAASVADHIDELRGTLDKHLSTVAREVREAQLTLDAKTQAVASYDEGFSLVATLLSDLLYTAGKDDLAASLRPSLHRPGKVVGDTDTSPPSEQKQGNDA